VLARKDELGNRAAFCAGCGWGRRFLAGVPAELPESCPDCGQPVLAECPACAEGITSLMQITCSACGEALRDAEFFGRPIRRKPERHAAPAAAPECAGEAAAAFAAEAE
jgi:predicted amidophosphoribosyltransferase